MHMFSHVSLDMQKMTRLHTKCGVTCASAPRDRYLISGRASYVYPTYSKVMRGVNMSHRYWRIRSSAG